MMKVSADTIYPITSAPLKNHVLILNEQGMILAIEPEHLHDSVTVKKMKGILVPGFVNAHCHLELSHMKGKIETGTTLIPFIKNVITKRGIPHEEILESIVNAEAEMLRNGIVAVGDISNTTDTFVQKSKHHLAYHTFVEMFDLMQEDKVDETFEKYLSVYEALELPLGHHKSAVPHAPYSVTKRLFQKINELNTHSNSTISIHNQETLAEQDLFLSASGGFVDFYGSFGNHLNGFQGIGKGSIHYALENMDAQKRTLFVHNTLTSKNDIEAAQSWNPNCFWATCPNANLYIENRLPNYQHFLDTNAKVCIGTDSLTSNWQLDIWEEVKTILKYQSYLDIETVLRWATLNGAEALGMSDKLGSFEVGKSPGVVWVDSDGRVERIL
jgi:aminodeoxyfutalosine deaminase